MLAGILVSAAVCAQPASDDSDEHIRLKLGEQLLPQSTPRPEKALATPPKDVVPEMPLRRSLLLAALHARLDSVDQPGLSFDDLLAVVVLNHPDVNAKRADLGVAKANQDASRWQYFPTPSVQVRPEKKGESASVFSVQQPLWAGGRLDASFDAAGARVQSATHSISEAQYSLALRVANIWQSWLQAKNRGEAMERGIALLNVYSDSVRQRIKGGVSPEVDRELVESRLAQARGDRYASQAAERSAVSQLSQILGRPIQAGELSTSRALNAPLPALDILLEQAVANSMTLKRLQAEVEAAQHDTTQKRAGLLPTLAVKAEYQRTDPSNTSHFIEDRRVMLVMDYVPGAGLSARSGIDAAAERVNGVRENLETARRDLLTRVSADYEDHVASLGRQKDAQRTVKAAAEVLASYDRLFVAGKRNWLDVLNAARELMQAEIALADVEALVLGSYNRLRLHAGEFGWQQAGT